MGADAREMRLAHAGEVGIEQCTLPSSHRAAAWSMTARFVLAHKRVESRAVAWAGVEQRSAFSVQFSSVYFSLVDRSVFSHVIHTKVGK